MKRSGWRVALTVATLGLALVAGLVAFNWTTVRDHAEAWWFVWTRHTRIVSPGADEGTLSEMERLYQQLADRLECPVVFDPTKPPHWRFTISPGTDRENSLALGNYALKLLREDGWLIREQRFPRRALIVLHHPYTSQEEALEHVKWKAERQRAAQAVSGGQEQRVSGF